MKPFETANNPSWLEYPLGICQEGRLIFYCKTKKEVQQFFSENLDNLTKTGFQVIEAKPITVHTPARVKESS